MTQHTITAFFDSRSDAVQAVEELANAGIPRSSLRIMPEENVSNSGSTQNYDTSSDEKGFWASLSELFMPDDDRYTYAEAMNRGDIMVSATVDETQAARVEDILEQRGTINVDEREASWRNEGWQGYQGSTSGDGMLSGGMTEKNSDRTTMASDNNSMSREGDEVIPVMEEQIRVGKRQVNTGKVKVRSYVVETPVSEQVTLREENVHVERRPVDRPVTNADTSNIFRDRTIEAEAHGEEAVVSKEARIVEEVAVSKTSDERTETVQDTVRHTEVEVEDDKDNSRQPRKANRR